MMASIKMMALATVSDPRTEGKQTKYLVTSHRSDVSAPSPAGETQRGQVYHLHSEFQWLYERLIRERRGAVVPIAGLRFGIAAKAGVGPMVGTGNEDDTVEGRCRRLDAFMREVSSNPELLGAPSLEVFLTHGTGEEFDAAKAKLEGDVESDNDASDDDAGNVDGSAAASPPPKSQSKMKRTGFRQYMAKTVAKTATAVAARQGKAKLHETDDEEHMKVADQYVKDLEVQVKSMADQASTLNRSGRDSAVAWVNFGKAAGLWAEVLKSRHDFTVAHENAHVADSSTLGQTYARLGTIATLSGNASAKMTEAVERKKGEFAKSVQDLLALVSALKVALHKRSNCQLMCTSRLQHASKVSAQPSADAKEVERAKKDADETKHELEQATKRFLREMERVDTNLDRLLCRVVEAYAQIELETAKGMHEIWSEMVKVGNSAARNGEGTSEQGDEEVQGRQKEAGDTPMMPSAPMPSAPPPPEPSAPPLE